MILIPSDRTMARHPRSVRGVVAVSPKELRGLETQQTELGRKLVAARKQLSDAEGDVGRAEQGLHLAKECLHDSARTYREADPQTRRRWNQVFFTKIWIGPRGVVGAELTDEFGKLLADELVEKLEKLPAEPDAFRARGSNRAYLVETVGIEPTSAGASGRRLRA